MPETISENRTQQRNMKHIVGIPVLAGYGGTGGVLQGFLSGQSSTEFRRPDHRNPAVSLAEKIIEMPVTQIRKETKQVVNTHVQHAVNAVEAEKPIINEKINQVTKHVEIPQLQIVEKTAKTPETQITLRALKPLRVWAMRLPARWSRSKRIFLQNPLHPCSSLNPSRKLLQLLLSIHNPLLS